MKKFCKVCGREFDAKSNRALYDSDDCRRTARHDRENSWNHVVRDVQEHLDEYQAGIDDYKDTRGEGRYGTMEHIESLPKNDDDQLAMVSDSDRDYGKTEPTAIVADMPRLKTKVVKCCKICGRELAKGKQKFCSDECRKADRKDPHGNTAIRAAAKRQRDITRQLLDAGFTVITSQIAWNGRMERHTRHPEYPNGRTVEIQNGRVGEYVRGEVIIYPLNGRLLEYLEQA